MNLALGAIVLIILLYPGILARYAYLSGPYSSKNFSSSLVDEFILSLIPAIFVQLLAYCFTAGALNYEVDLELIYKLIIGPFPIQNSKEVIRSIDQQDFETIKNSITAFTIYLFCISILSFLIGRGFRWLVAHYFIYNKNQALRLNNEWWDIFSARVLGKERFRDIKELLKENKRDLFVTVAALVNVKDSCYLYFGKLEEYYFSENKLDRICLSNVYRRKLSDDKKPVEETATKKEPSEENIESIERDLDDRYYKLPGTIFVISYEQIINLDVEYVLISKAE
jgi:hypothetical protein